MQTAADRKWMIKSENKILGPYSYDQIEDLLKKRQISLIDEVRDMNTRWLYVRESESLKNIVDQVREDLANTDDHTKTFQTRTAQNVTKTGTITQDIVIDGKKFEMPTFTNVTVEDVEFTEVPMGKTKTPSRVRTSQQFVSATDPNIKHQISKSSRAALIVLASVLAGVLLAGVGFYVYQGQVKKKQEQHAIMAIRKYSLFGLQEKVVEVFGSMRPELQKQVIPEIIPMIPKLDSVGLINGAHAINSLKTNMSISDQKRALLDVVEFIQALQDQNFKKARESLIRAKDLDPASDLIKENDAILNFYENKFDIAAKSYSELYKVTPKGRVLFGWAMSVVNKEILNPDEYNKLTSEIDRYTQGHVDFKKELLLINMYLGKRSGNEQGFNIDYESFIATPLNMTQNFQIPLSVYSGIYSMYSVRGVFEKLKPFLPAAQRFVIETHIKLELGEVSAAQSLYSSYHTVLENVNDRLNLRLLLDYSLKNYSSVVAQEKVVAPGKLNTASHYALLMAKKKMNGSDDDIAPQLSFLRSEKNILSLWSQFLTIADQSKKLSFVQINGGMADDFIPFQEVKGAGE